MVYFLINNNFHYYDVKKHLEENGFSDSIGLIKIPHKLDEESISSKSFFKKQFRFEPIRNKSGKISILKDIFLSFMEIKKTLSGIDDKDTLIFYTDVERLNIAVAEAFVSRGAKVYLLTEGLSTYFTLRKPFDKKNFHVCASYVAKKILSNRLVFITKGLNGRGYRLAVDNKLINGVFVYDDVTCKNDIKKIIVRRPRGKMIPNLHVDSVLFLNSPIYNYYLDFGSFLKALDYVLDILNKRFSKVYFKFHPRENKEKKELQVLVLSKYCNIVVVDKDEPVENILYSYPVKFAASFSSVSLINLNDSGVQPIFCYPYVASLKELNFFKEMDDVLKDMKYFYPKTLESINVGDSGFEKNICSSYTIKDYVD